MISNPSLQDLYKDDKSQMTYGRRIASWLASNYESWYYPKASEHKLQGIHISDGWSFFEHISLGRYVIIGEEEHNKSIFNHDEFVRAAIGEDDVDTALYPIWGTGVKDLADFGVGVGLYFSNLKKMVLILMVTFLINLSSVLYYHSKSYNSHTEAVSSVMGSATCDSYSWRPCVDCTAEDWDTFPSTGLRFARTENGKLSFILKNECNVDFDQLVVPVICSLCFVVLSFLYVSYANTKKQVELDEAQLTTSDYSILFTNPPRDARDPEEWKAYALMVAQDDASDGAVDSVKSHVTCCTVALDNEQLVRALAKRAELLVQFDNMLPENVSLAKSDVYDHTMLTEMADRIPQLPLWKRCLCFQSATSLVNKIITLDAHIEDLSKEERHACGVFITFEREQTQRKVLKRLSTGRLYHNVPEKYKFRKKHVLHVQEPAESSSIRWQNIHDSHWIQISRLSCSTFLCLLIIFAGAYLTYIGKKYIDKELYGFTAPALIILGLNIVTPPVVTAITNFESHHHEGHRQTSLYLKLLIFRCVSTAIVIYIITPISDTTSTDDDGLLVHIASLFLAESLTTPFVRLMDIVGHFNRHYMAPRAVDHRRLLNCFSGGTYNISERYTNSSKLIFLALFYSFLIPTSFGFAALALFIHYWADKFTLLRTWRLAPDTGPEINTLNDFFFVPAVLFFFATGSAYLIVGFPYDNACDHPTVKNVPVEYLGFHNIINLDGEHFNVTISENNGVYTYCNMRIETFPPFTTYEQDDKSWMVPAQKTLVNFNAYVSLIVLGISTLCLCFLIHRFIKSLFTSTYEPSGRASNITYSQVAESSAPAYIPRVQIKGLAYPMFLCDLRDLSNTEILGYDLPIDTLEELNLVYGVRRMRELRDTGTCCQPASSIFSIFKYWNPEDAERSNLEKRMIKERSSLSSPTPTQRTGLSSQSDDLSDFRSGSDGVEERERMENASVALPTQGSEELRTPLIRHSAKF